MPAGEFDPAGVTASGGTEVKGIEPGNFAAFALAASVLMASGIASAGEIEAEIAFAGGKLTVMRDDDGAAILYEGQELARNYFAGFDRIAEIEGEQVAIFYLGDGGNACGPSTLLVWRDDEGEIRSDNLFAEDCGGPTPSVSEEAIVFVPYVMPGGSDIIHRWTPSSGLSSAGKIIFMAEPGTGWNDLDFTRLDHPVDFFSNEEAYDGARALLGEDFESWVIGLSVSSGFEDFGSLKVSQGCMPHNCGGFESLLAADPVNRRIYAATYDGTGYRQWPDALQWPEEALKAFKAFSNR